MIEYDLPFSKKCGFCEGYGYFWRPIVHGGVIACHFCDETGEVKLQELEIEQGDNNER